MANLGVVVGILLVVLVFGGLACGYFVDYNSSPVAMNLGPSMEEAGTVKLYSTELERVKGNRAAYAERARQAGIAPPVPV